MKNPICVEKIKELIDACANLSRPLGFVPTMGYLHEGHLSLVRRAKQDCDSVVISIFVNPTQFGPQEDLENYPRDLESDLHLLSKLSPDLVWIPTVDDLYPAGYQTWVEVEKLTHPLEGSMRPGHFRGVTTVVAKLFNAVQPQYAYFGQKDAQQVAVIRRMTQDLNYPIEIITCPTVREVDGLAMSSRNKYLKPQERKAALVLYKALTAAKKAYEDGECNAEVLRQIMTETINAEPMAKMQYVSCADYESLEELSTASGKALLSMAVFIGKTRLIDNVVLE